MWDVSHEAHIPGLGAVPTPEMLHGTNSNARARAFVRSPVNGFGGVL